MRLIEADEVVRRLKGFLVVVLDFLHVLCYMCPKDTYNIYRS